MIRPVSSQLAEFLQLVPTPASSDEVDCSAVNYTVGRLKVQPNLRLQEA